MAQTLEVPKAEVKVLKKFSDEVPKGAYSVRDTKTAETFALDARELSDLRAALGARHKAEGVKDQEKKQIKKLSDEIDGMLKDLAEETAEILSLPENVIQHPAGAKAPKLQKDEFKALKRSIKEQGFLDEFPVTMYQGMILDGWHRWKACLELGVTPKVTTYRGNDPIGFVMASLHRRHLSDDMKAQTLVALQEMNPELSTDELIHTVPGITASRINRAQKIAVKYPALADAVSSGEIKLGDADKIAAAAEQDDDLKERLVSSPDDFDFAELAETHKDIWKKSEVERVRLDLEGEDGWTYFDLVYSEDGEVVGEAYVRELADAVDVRETLDEIGSAVELSTDIKVIKAHLAENYSDRMVNAMFISFFPEEDRGQSVTKKRNQVAKKLAEYISSENAEDGDEEEEEAGSDD